MIHWSVSLLCVANHFLLDRCPSPRLRTSAHYSLASHSLDVPTPSLAISVNLSVRGISLPHHSYALSFIGLRLRLTPHALQVMSCEPPSPLSSSFCSVFHVSVVNIEIDFATLHLLGAAGFPYLATLCRTFSCILPCVGFFFFSTDICNHF